VGALAGSGFRSSTANSDSTAGGGSGGTARTSTAGSAAIGAGGGGGGSGAGGAGGLTVLTSRGGGSAGPAGRAGSAALPAGFLPFTGAAVSSNIFEAGGNDTPRSRASRSTNCRATTSSMVLEALLTSMPARCLSSAITSWLEVLSSSATL
jgi:hypothetical protein